MESIITWTEKIARQVVPDEIDLAPFIAEKFAQGGKVRKKLLQPDRGGALGGIGAGATIWLPWILQAIHDATPFLAGLLTSKSISSSLIIIRALKTALATHQHSQLLTKQQALDNALAQTDASLLIKKCAETMTRTLQKSGISAAKSEETAYEVMLVLLDDAPDAVEFLHQLTEKK